MIRTLVVDDDFRVADIHRGYLERLETFEPVGVAHSGRQAIEMARELKPDLCLLDIYLPDTNGVHVARALAASQEPVDLIVITAARDMETIHGAIARGALHYLVKPFSFATFREKLQSYAAWRSRLDQPGEGLDQDALDLMLGALHQPSVPPLPKGLSTATLGLVLRTLQGIDGDLSATEVAERTGVSRVTARRYLDHLVQTGRAELRLQYGAGRPQHRYVACRPRRPEE